MGSYYLQISVSSDNVYLFLLILFFRKANEEAYYLTTSTESSSNITFQHTYEVYKHGASPIESAQLIVKVPLAIEDLKTLIYIYKPQVRIYGFTLVDINC